MMNTKNLQNAIVKWWHTGRDYETGVMLFAKISKNKVLKRLFMQKSSNFYHRKLEYHLTKSVGLDWKNMPELPDETESSNPKSGVETQTIKEGGSEIENTIESEKPGVSTDRGLLKEEHSINSDVESAFSSGQENNTPKLSGSDSVIPAFVPLVSDKPLSMYPKIIRQIKTEYSKLYNQRSKKHYDMYPVPFENNPGNVLYRKELLEQITELSVQMEHLYSFIAEYEKTGKVPGPEQVWPDARETKNNPSAQDSELTPVQLKKKKKNLQSANTKDKNHLLFQSTKKEAKENPMPDGPKKDKILARMQKRSLEIDTLDKQLLSLENAG